MEDLKETYNRIADDWLRDHYGDEWWIPGIEKFISYLDPGFKILDVGCGAGEKSKILIDKGFRVVGIDFAERMIELAKQQVPEAEFLVADIKNLDVLDSDFDGILAQAVLLHIHKKYIFQVLNNLRQKLKPEGYMFICVKERQPGQPEEEIVTENDYGYEYSRFFSYYSMDEMKKYLTDLNFKIVFENIANSGRTNWIQIICKKNNGE